ncbi:MAG: SDR family NAD(P)-dependent oxidoreductase [Pirellulales bacterium]|nr:SDR family NAD(P)-dependent oxidoreductase [Pirellulales bacterium]
MDSDRVVLHSGAMTRRVLRDRRTVVTGASRGIGRELALALARRHTRMVLVARSAEPLERTVAECRDLGAAVESVVGDVTDPWTRDAIRFAVQERWGGLDLLVNNAGVSAHGAFAGGDEATFRRVMDVNLFAPAELTRLLLPFMGPGGAIVNVSSILGHRAAPFNSEYSASKFALRGWSEALRAELSGRQIDVLLASPGTTDTEFFNHLVAKRAEMPWKQSKGLPPAVVAEQIVRGVERGRREVFPNWRGGALVFANRLFPGAVDRWMRRYGGGAGD